MHVKCEGMDIKDIFDAIASGDYGLFANSVVVVKLEGLNMYHAT